MGILNIDLNNINLDNNFDVDDPDTIILIRVLSWHIKFEEHKEFTIKSITRSFVIFQALQKTM